MPERLFVSDFHFLIASIDVVSSVANLRPARVPPFKGVLLTQKDSLSHPTGCLLIRFSAFLTNDLIPVVSELLTPKTHKGMPWPAQAKIIFVCAGTFASYGMY